MPPKITVIIPAYNAEKYLSQSIESVLHQTFHDYELIIIDDASTDRTWEICKVYVDRDSRVIVLRNQKNLGIAGNRNRGLSVAQGEYVAWQDADDISLPERLEKQCKFMDLNPEVAIVGAFLEFFDDSGRLHIRKYPADDKTLRRIIFRYSPVAQPVAMIRKKCLDELDGYNLRYPPAEDLDMSFRLGEKYCFANLQEVLVRYRQHDESATISRLKTIELNTIEIRRRYFNHPSYSADYIDRLYNFLQHLSVYFVPPRLKLWLFNKLRNSDA